MFERVRASNSRASATKKGDLKDQVLLAALKCSNGDVTATFTFEELLIAAWEANKAAWGMRGFEREHPDPERLHREVDSRGKGQKGLVGLGYLEKVETRTYRLTPAGLGRASRIRPSDSGALEKATRALEGELKKILEHPVFTAWLKEQKPPKSFRDAGHFCGIAPGTPPQVIQERVESVERSLHAASDLLKERGVDKIGEQRGGLLYEEEDVLRALEFQRMLKETFAKDLRLLGADL